MIDLMMKALDVSTLGFIPRSKAKFNLEIPFEKRMSSWNDQSSKYFEITNTWRTGIVLESFF